jgi:hypothetical protein
MPSAVEPIRILIHPSANRLGIAPQSKGGLPCLRIRDSQVPPYTPVAKGLESLTTCFEFVAQFPEITCLPYGTGTILRTLIPVDQSIDQTAHPSRPLPLVIL